MKAGWLILLLVVTGAAPRPLRAQGEETTVRGRVLGPDNAQLAGQRVVLHRVLNSEGATIAETETGPDGSFELRAAAETDTSAIYFVAVRYEGELYIGPAFRAGQEVISSQVIQVGVPGTSATDLLEPTADGPRRMGRPLTNRNWLLLLIPLLGVAAVAIYALAPRTRVPQDRALLIRIAELDERMATAPVAQRESLRDERTRLMAQLRAG